MPPPSHPLARLALCFALASPIVATVLPAAGYAQSSATATLSGSVLDPKGVPLPGATVAVKNEATGTKQTMSSDGQGKYAFTNLAPGKYTLTVDAPGFNTSSDPGLQLAAGPALSLPVTLQLGNVSEQVTVEASEANSIAAALAPMDALLEETSARTEITQSFISNFTSPVADYGEIVALAPGTFTTNGNGIGLGQSKTYFRGFPDGDYDIDYDGVPVYDTNTPTHHSWVFFPSQWIGGVDFDRSPGTASTTGPTPFGGSIHLLSRDISPIQNIRGGFSYGSYNTFLYDGEYDSGSILRNHKLSLELDFHHMSSDGYQTFNYQKRSAGAIKVQYKFSDKTILTGFSGVVKLDANTPNFNPTRCQVYGVSATNAYSCAISSTNSTLMPFTGSGLNFYLTNNSDPANYLDYQYNRYTIPTDVEYVDLKSQFGHGITFDFKPYTYDYDNAELYTNSVPITEATTINGSSTYNGVAIQPCNVDETVKKLSSKALTCGVDKYNSYRKYGELLNVRQVSKFGILRAGMWYEWARTDRHQYPSDPLNNWHDDTLPNFAEQFWNNSFQPFVEYEFHVTKALNVTPGVKYAYNTIDTRQYADNGKTIGNLCNTLVTPNVCVPFVSNSGSYSAWLPSIDGNYRIRNNWSAYAQLSTGTIVPPSSVYDFNQTISKTNPTPGILIAPKQQRSTTYQTGTVLKLKRVTFDADYYRIRFQNSYSSFTDPVSGEQDNYLQPSSVSKGVEGESNIYFNHGLSLYLNATAGKATYTGNVYTACTTGTTGCTATSPVLTESAPSSLWVQQTPSDTEAEGITYQKGAWDMAFLNKRVGRLYLDNGAYHNQVAIQPFTVTNLFLNYTLRSGTHFDQTKIKLSFNNIFNQTNLTSVGPTGSVIANPLIAANNTFYADSFNTAGPTLLSGTDTIGHLPERTVTLSITFGWSPER